MDTGKGGNKKIDAHSSVQGDGDDIMEGGSVLDEKSPLLGTKKEDTSKWKKLLRFCKIVD